MINPIYIFEGKSIADELFYGHSLSLHETFDGAEKQMGKEIALLKKQLYDIENFNKKFDEDGSPSIECTLIDTIGNKRTLTITKWLVLD